MVQATVMGPQAARMVDANGGPTARWWEQLPLGSEGENGIPVILEDQDVGHISIVGDA